MFKCRAAERPYARGLHALTDLIAAIERSPSVQPAPEITHDASRRLRVIRAGLCLGPLYPIQLYHWKCLWRS
jgi:hypothetical protein